MANRHNPVILLLLGAASCYGQTLVQQTSTSTCATTSGSSLSCVLGSAPGGSNELLVLYSGPISSTISSITGATCTLAKASAASGTQDSEIWKCSNPTSATVTVNVAAAFSGQQAAGNVSEWSGLINTVDGTASNSGTTGTVTTGSATTTHASDVIFGTCSMFSGNTFSTGPTNSFTALNTPNSASFQGAYKIVSSTGSQSTGWTYTGGAPIYDATIAGIQASGGAAVVHTLSLLGVGK